MTSSGYKHISRVDFASLKLQVALRLYMLGQEYPTAIKLAGAAEELLSKMAIGKGLEPSLKRTLRRSLALHKELWGHDANETEFAQLRNLTLNDLARPNLRESIYVDYEHEAASMLNRALENFLLCTGANYPGHTRFTIKRIANWRAKQKLL